jgi:hypothetical protein
LVSIPGLHKRLKIRALREIVPVIYPVPKRPWLAEKRCWGGGVNALDAIDKCNLVHPCSCLQQNRFNFKACLHLARIKDEPFSICGGRILSKVRKTPAGRYNNPIPPRFLAPVPAQYTNAAAPAKIFCLSVKEYPFFPICHLLPDGTHLAETELCSFR